MLKCSARLISPQAQFVLVTRSHYINEGNPNLAVISLSLSRLQPALPRIPWYSISSLTTSVGETLIPAMHVQSPAPSSVTPACYTWWSGGSSRLRLPPPGGAEAPPGGGKPGSAASLYLPSAPLYPLLSLCFVGSGPMVGKDESGGGGLAKGRGHGGGYQQPQRQTY